MSVRDKKSLIRTIVSLRGAIQALGVNSIGVFGSFVEDTPSDESDVDILVEFSPGTKSFDNFVELGFLLEEALGREVDIVTRASLSPHIGPTILDQVEYVDFDS